MTVAALVFDLDGTLYAETRFALSGYAAVARHIEATTARPAREAFRAMAGALRRGRRATAFQDAAQEIGLGAARLDEWLAVYRAHEPRLRLPRLTRDVLARLRPRWRLGILTNGIPSVQRAKVRALGVEPLVDAVVYAEEHGSGAGKPDPGAFLEVLARLGVEPQDAAFVGDDPATDMAGARAVGMRAVLVAAGGRRHADGEVVDGVLASLAALPELAARWSAEVEHAH